MAMDEKQRIKELENEVKLLKEILDNMHEGVYITDTNNKIMWINKVESEIIRQKREELIGKRENELFPMLEGSIHEYTIRTGQPVIEEPLGVFLAEGYKVGMINNTYPFFENGKINAVYTIALYLNYAERYFAKAAEYRHMIDEGKKRKSNGTRFTLYDIVCKSDAIKQLIEISRKIAINNSSVLLIGETGTGKELFAQGIHNASLNANGPFIAVNCAAIPETLLESLLFGTVKGAYTGATNQVGLFEQAEGGTLFLDEINSMSLLLQGKLLRVLQERIIRRLGDNVEHNINCRILSSTNEDPFEKIKAKQMRQDLFYRLSAVTLQIPPLRELKEDILPLSEFFIQKYNKQFGTKIEKLAKKVEMLFLKYNWPGNVRELEHVIEYAMNMVRRSEKQLAWEFLPPYLIKYYHKMTKEIQTVPNQRILSAILQETEKRAIEEAIQRNEGNISRAAKELGIFREALYYRIKKFNLNKSEWIK
jgi:arginine utilization regulatory protein